MKNLSLILLIFLFLTNTVWSQGASETNKSSDPDIVIKLAPLNLLNDGFKIGVDYASSEKVTHDFQFTTSISLVSDFPIQRVHGLYRLKRDLYIVPNPKKLNGLYIAPGFLVAVQEIENKKYDRLPYTTLFTDLGIQFTKILSVDIFFGAGYTIADRDFFSKDVGMGCVGCGINTLAGTMNLQNFAFRLGAHIGISPSML